MNVQPLHESPHHAELRDDLNADLLTIVAAVVDDIEGADHAALSLTGSRETMVTTSDTATLLEMAQRDADEGPTLDAGRSGVITRINYLSDGSWPTFGQVCADRKIRSVAALPLTDGTDTLGVLTVYSSDHHAFGAPELRTGRAAAAELTRILHDR